MYNFSLREDRTLIAINKDTGECKTVAEKISWFHKYDNFVIALMIDKNLSSFYKISLISLSKELLVNIPRNFNNTGKPILPSFTLDQIIFMQLHKNNMVYIVRKNYNLLTCTGKEIFSLMVTNIETKETKTLYDWECMSEAGFPAIGIPDCYEEPEVTLDDEWINIKTTFKKPTRDYWFTNGVIEVKNFRIRYDGSDKEEIR